MSSSGLLMPLFIATIFLSAALLFLVQLVFARMVLPLLGGSPAVWNTAMVFYQGVLLAGYGYAHFSTRQLKLRPQVLLQGALLLLPLAVLPLVIPTGWQPPTDGSPILWLLGLLALAVGLPFFMVSTTSPLLQRWFAASGHPQARDPYFLYAASNAGSLLGLLSYPFLIEPNLTLASQSRWWSWGYGVLVLATCGCGWLVWRRGNLPTTAAASSEPARAKKREEPLSARRRSLWVLWAFVPSSLMLSVTTYLTSDIAAVPLLWVLPLAIYLGTFILVFARTRLISEELVQRLWPISVIPLVMAMGVGATTPISVLMVLHLLAFFFAAMICHGRLAKDRPPAEHLTEYYFLISLGGVLGGIFNALIAPQLFTAVVEYPLLLVLACLVGGIGTASSPRKSWAMNWLAPVGIALLTWAMVELARQLGVEPDSPANALAYGIPAFFCFLLSARPVRFGLSLGAVLLVAGLTRMEDGRGLHAQRSFFGIHKVTLDSSGRYHRLFHGKTLHGMQSLEPGRRREALTYYHPSGPAGQLFEQLGTNFNRVGAVGLGAGALATYGRPGQEWIFYEIDPVVHQIASEEKFFTYLRDSEATVRVVLGDARLSLEREPDNHFSVLVLDAYSSDSIPVHLITREAVQLYLRKLAPGGLLVFHVSNLHLKLRPVVASLARDAGLFGLLQEDTEMSPQDWDMGKSPSQWMVLARSEADFGPLRKDSRWHRETGEEQGPVWTDNFSSILRVLDWSLE